MKVAMPLVNDFELVEMTAVLDILRRADIEVETISLFNEDVVSSSNNVRIFVDKKMKDVNLSDYTMIVLSGGMGTDSYYNSDTLLKKLKEFEKENKRIAAICAAPSVLANTGILKDKKATVFPSCVDEFEKNNIKLEKIGVVKSHNIITASSVNFAIDFSLEIVEELLGKEKRIEIEKEIVRI